MAGPPVLQSETGDTDLALRAYSTSAWLRSIVTMVPILGGAFDTYASTKVQNQLAEVDDRFRKWVEEANDFLKRSLHRLALSVDKLDEQMRKQTEDLQYGRILNVYAFEAAREALDERMTMLAAAAAGNVDPRLTIAEKARVERTLRELNPDDVLALWGIHRTEGLHDLDGTKHHSTAQLRAVVFERADAEVLRAAGCIGERTLSGYGGGIVEVHVTRLGRTLLEVLHEYVSSREVGFPIPGRQPRPGDLPAAEAEALLGSIPQISRMLDYARRCEKIGKQYLMPPADAPDEAELLLNLFDDDGKAMAQDAVSSKQALFDIRIKPLGDGDALQMSILGHQDILRVAADSIDAQWLGR